MRLRTCISALAIGAILASCGGTTNQTSPNATAELGSEAPVPTGAVIEATDTLPDQNTDGASQPTEMMPQPTTTGGTEAMPEATTDVMPEPTAAGTESMPESASGAPMAEITNWQTVELAELGLSLDVPADWEASSDGMEWAPAGATTPRVGVTTAEMNADWTPSSMLPDGAQVRDTQLVNLPWAQAQLYTVETSDAAQELHAIVRGPNSQAINFYAIPAPGNDAKSMQPVLDHMLNSVDASGV